MKEPNPHPVEFDEDYRCEQRDIAFERLSSSIHQFFNQDSIFERIDTLNEVFGHALQSTNGDIDDDGNPIYAMSNIAVIDLFDKHVNTIKFFVELHCINEFMDSAELKEWVR